MRPPRVRLSRRRPGRHRALPRRSGDEGFLLLETLVAISLISVVMAAFTTFFVNAVASTNQQRATQAATQIANSGVDTLRSLAPSDLVTGRDTASVSSQFGAASSTVTPWLSAMTQASDSSPANSGATAAVPTIGVAQTVNNIAYTMNYYLGRCSVPAGVSTNASCRTGGAVTDVQYLRAVVAVTWAGAHCPITRCTYVTATLISAVDDPLFNLNAVPPAAPVATNPGAQSSQVGDTVSLQLAYTASPPATWALTSGTLPAGLYLDAATGKILGTPTTVTSSTPLTFTLTDFFGRQTTVSFSWTVLAGLLITQPANQASVVGTAITPLTLTVTGGSPPYTWTDPNSTLPAGLTLSAAGRVTGTPTTPGMSTVVLTVTDSTTTHSSTTRFTWTVTYPPFAATNPGAQTSTLGTADGVVLSTTGGSGSFSWTGGASLPAGLTLTSAGVISGTPTTAGATSVSLIATDTTTRETQTVAFGWTVYARPTVGNFGVSPLTVTVGQAVSFRLSTTCPNAPCTYTLDNGPGTFSIDGSGLLTGAVSGPAQSYGAVTFTVTDASGAKSSSSAFAVNVNAAPRVNGPGNQSAGVGAAVSLTISTTGGTPALTYSASGLPSWLSLNTSTGVITGTAPAQGATTSGISVTATDANGVSNTSAAFSWVVTGVPTVPRTVTVANGDTQIAVSWTAPASDNNAAITGYKATLNPGGTACTTTGALACTFTGLTDGAVYTVTVTATNSVGTGPASAAVTAIPYPALLTGTGRVLWLDGADAATLYQDSSGATPTTAAGQPVATWKDKSGAGNNVTTTGAAPTESTPVWANGLSSPTFSAGHYLSRSTGFPVNSDYSEFAAYRPTATCTGNIVSAAGTGNSHAFYTNAGAGLTLYHNGVFASSDGKGVANNTGYTASGTFVTATSTGTTDVNGGTVTTGTTPNQNTDASIQIGAYAGGNEFCGQIAEVIVLNRVVTAAERQKVEDYLNRKWLATPGAPTAVTATSGDGTATVSWTAPAANGSAAVTGYTVTAAPGGGSCTTTGALTCTITGLSNNTAYTVTVVASNGSGSGAASSPATVPRFTCQSAAVAASSYLTYPLAEASGTVAADVSGNNRPGTYTSTGVTYGVAGPCLRDTPASTAVTLNGSSGYVSGATAVNNPQVLSVGIWFKTGSVAGGKLIGLGNQSTGLSGQYDRHLYVDTAGKLTFGVYVGGTKTVTSANTYNNNAWHYAVASLAPSSDANPGLRLYVDGALVASDTTVTSAETVGTSYWRVGGDNLGGWPNGGSANYFAGSLAFASTYTTALTPAQVLAQYHAGQ